MEKKRIGIKKFIEKKKEEKFKDEFLTKMREDQYREAIEENRKKEDEKHFKLDVVKKAYIIARELGTEISRWSDYYDDIEVIKYDFAMEGVRIIYDLKYFDDEKYDRANATYDNYKGNYLFIYINGDKVFESQMTMDKPYDLDKFSNSDWPKVINKIYEFLPRLKEDKLNRERIEREKAKRLDTIRDYLNKFVEIQSYQGDPYTTMLIGLEDNDIAIGRTVINEGPNDISEFTIKYTIYHKGNEVLDFFFKNKSITVTPLHYIQGEWEKGFKYAIDNAYTELEAKNIGRINANVDRTLAKLKKMY